MFYNEPANLITYLPNYYEDNEEIIRLTDTENPEIDSLWDAVQETTDNQFIRLSGDKRIRQWEKLLRLRPDYAAQTLDYRKDVVIMRLSTRIPLTYRWLVALLTDIVGAEHFKIDLRHGKYFIFIHLMERPDIGEEFWFHLRRSIPANLGLGFKYTLTNRVASPYVAGLSAADRAKIFIPHPKVLDIHAKESLFGFTGAAVDKQKTVIPHKRPKDVSITSFFNVGALPVTDHQWVGIPHKVPRDVLICGLHYIGSGGLEFSRIKIPTKKVKGA